MVRSKAESFIYENSFGAPKRLVAVAVASDDATRHSREMHVAVQFNPTDHQPHSLLSGKQFQKQVFNIYSGTSTSSCNIRGRDI